MANPVLVCVGGPCAGMSVSIEPGRRVYRVQMRDNYTPSKAHGHFPAKITQHSYDVDCFEANGERVNYLRWEHLTPFGAVRELLSRYSGTPR